MQQNSELIRYKNVPFVFTCFIKTPESANQVAKLFGFLWSSRELQWVVLLNTI